MPDGFRLRFALPAEPKAIYRAWLSSREHAAMTGSKATASARVGGKFTAWDGYISGRNHALKPHWCIVQSWRTTEFPADAPDSRLELCIHARGRNGSEVLLIHSGLPADQVASLRSGWRTYYVRPMRRYFAALRRPPRSNKSKSRTRRPLRSRRPARRIRRRR